MVAVEDVATMVGIMGKVVGLEITKIGQIMENVGRRRMKIILILLKQISSRMKGSLQCSLLRTNFMLENQKGRRQ